ncbi:hypothetical protein K7X08_020186 [Anisodus acutangulus]|uniref:Uncharacterized protein n=1 Tax=Anisodus acutangulus TaxID=402998 RepID=A0A9Q1M607_9SOLA|nr:hypothetical protein K7X08_020186 [Anisodus acutangulus]
MKLVEVVGRSFLWYGTVEITKKALISWAKTCTPKAASVLNVMNMSFWNKAAVSEQLWAIANKKECLWVRWVHSYYLKQESVENCNIPANATWVIRKIIVTRKHFLQLPTPQDNLQARLATMVKGNKFSIKSVYLSLLPVLPKVPWKCLTLLPNIHPRHKFTL